MSRTCTFALKVAALVFVPLVGLVEPGPKVNSQPPERRLARVKTEFTGCFDPQEVVRLQDIKTTRLRRRWCTAEARAPRRKGMPKSESWSGRPDGREEIQRYPRPAKGRDH